MAETDTGIKENVAGLLCYVLWWVTGVIFLIIEPKNKFIRFHAFQSIIVYAAITIAAVIFTFIPVLQWFMPWIIWLFGIILWIVLMVKANQGLKYKLPIAGDMAEKWAG
ncbi:MAG: hypothetical protein PVG61_05510 [Dehalococcoidia bacterium]|jgi:uncharacterized membrane protein